MHEPQLHSLKGAELYLIRLNETIHQLQKVHRPTAINILQDDDCYAVTTLDCFPYVEQGRKDSLIKMRNYLLKYLKKERKELEDIISKK